jgi:hypothetical protein
MLVFTKHNVSYFVVNYRREKNDRISIAIFSGYYFVKIELRLKSDIKFDFLSLY